MPSIARWSSRAPSTAPTAWPTASCAPASRRRRSTATSPRARASARSPGSRAVTIRIVVATDIAARGIDVEGSLARHQLRHPGGSRELRAPHRPHWPRGPSGVALSFCTPHERGDLHAIERLSRLRIPPVELPRELASRAPTGQPRVPTGQPQPRFSPERVRDSVRDSAPVMQALPVERAPRPGYAAPRRRRPFA